MFDDGEVEQFPRRPVHAAARRPHLSVRRVILDTDVASLSIKNQLPLWLLGELLGAQIGITFITLAELTGA